MRTNVINNYTYTLETIVQAGRERMGITSVPVRTNGELRPSRLFHSMWGYVKRSMLTILRAFLTYQPLEAFTILSLPPILFGVVLIIRYAVFRANGEGARHIHSLIISSMAIIIGALILTIGLLADTIAANRKILQDVQFHVKRLEYEVHGNRGVPDLGGSVHESDLAGEGKRAAENGTAAEKERSADALG